MAKIDKIKAREILDSRGVPTIEADVILNDGSFARASVPAGISTGTHEALELRDEEKERFSGLGVLKAVRNVNEEIGPKLKDKDALLQKEIDQAMIELDGRANKSRLGANAILAISLAICKAQANSLRLPLYEYLNQISGLEVKPALPTPMFNLINGGRHADNKLSFQEFMAIPFGPLSFREKLRKGVEIFYNLKNILKEKGLSTAIGEEGGFAPQLEDDEEAIRLLQQAGTSHLGLDIAPSDSKGPDYFIELAKKYPILYLEDPLPEDDWEGWRKLTRELEGKLVLTGDDIFVTNPERLKRGIKEGVANAVIIKPNQIGTLTEVFEVIKLAYQNRYLYIISHRSGETNDSFISDLAVGTAASYIKAGAPCRGERLAKYNRLLEIEENV